MWVYAALNGVLCAVAIFAAAHVPVGRRVALVLAGFLFLNWAQYVAAWTPFAPAPALRSIGFKVYGDEIWMLVDGFGGMLALGFGFRYWWGWALWSTALTQELIHGGKAFHWFDFWTYSHLLDAVLLAQVALFLLIGGRGSVDRVRDWTSELRRHRRHPSPSRARSGEACDAGSD